MKWNPFAKDDTNEKDLEAQLKAMPGAPDMSKMNFMQKMAMKKFLKMSPEEQKKMAAKMMTPKNVEKNKKEILDGLEKMRASRQISDDQYRLAKKKLGL